MSAFPSWQVRILRDGELVGQLSTEAPEADAYDLVDDYAGRYTAAHKVELWPVPGDRALHRSTGYGTREAGQ